MRSDFEYRNQKRSTRPIFGRAIYAMIAALALAVPFHGFAQSVEGSASELLARAGYDTTAGAPVLEVFSTAQANNVPAGALLSRLQEGLAKRVPPDRIASALMVDVTVFVRARDVIDAVQPGSPLVADLASWERAASLLRAGWSNEELRAIVWSCVARPAAFRAATALSLEVEQWGVARDVAIDLASAAAESSIPPDEFPALASLLSLARERRIAADRAARMITDGLREGRSRKQLELLFAR